MLQRAIPYFRRRIFAGEPLFTLLLPTALGNFGSRKNIRKNSMPANVMLVHWSRQKLAKFATCQFKLFQQLLVNLFEKAKEKTL